MAYPKELNNLYKEEKVAGLTNAKSFPEWHKLHQAGLTHAQLSVKTDSPVVDEEFGLEMFIEPLTPEQLDALELVLSHPKLIGPPELTSEQIEYSINHMPLTQEQILAITTTLAEPIVEPDVTIPTSKAAHARMIYDQMENAATISKVALVRKDIIKRFMVELPISDKGAATYLQNIKAKKGLINHK